jgi:hypothetical protein
MFKLQQDTPAALRARARNCRVESLAEATDSEDARLAGTDDGARPTEMARATWQRVTLMHSYEGFALPIELCGLPFNATGWVII